jgi:hypothetical protein
MSQEQENIIINRPGRSTYPQEKSVLTSAATPKRVWRPAKRVKDVNSGIGGAVNEISLFLEAV